MILDDILVKRKEHLEREKQVVSLEEIKKQAYKIQSEAKKFHNALACDNLSVIAEVKKASPSKGIIRQDFEPVKIAQEYEQSGADAISVLTEEYYFKGSNEYLKNIRQSVDIPLLRKDFIFDEYQIYEARALQADAILLIAAILDQRILKDFIMIAKSLNLDCLVEVHDRKELELALKCNAEIIGINNRNLKTFEVNLDTTIELIDHIPDNRIIVSESGITTNQDMKVLKASGVDAVLIGETLVRSDNPGQTLKNLRGDL